MQIIVLADEVNKDEFKAKKTAEGIRIEFIDNLSELSNYNSADVVLFLKNEIDKADYTAFSTKPVLIHSVINTLKEINLPENFIRINGWSGFLNREIWEIAAANENMVKDIFERLEWKYLTVADEPGLVSARIICMIINEAYFALGEDVSTKDEIDMAMKLGTNYPFGPFEWSKRIGLINVYNLLHKLSATDKRYTVAPALKKDLNS
jgi:3-hydroxybutyryl-CoA dehydrogenase